MQLNERIGAIIINKGRKMYTVWAIYALVASWISVTTSTPFNVVNFSDNEIDQPQLKDVNVKKEDWQPQQIHIAYGVTPDEMVIQWTTMDEAPASIAEYGVTGAGLTSTAEGKVTMFRDGGSEHRTMWMHRVHLTDLLPGVTYEYHCGSPLGWSELFFFTAMKNGTDWPVRVAMYGDMGAVNAQSLARLQQDTQRGMYDAIIHVGDFGYDMDSDNGRVGDMFMNQIQPIAAYVPYMTCPGNHEWAYNFSNYRARFSMPDYESTESLFYSWNMGPIHFISIDTEAYYYLQFGLKVLSNQWTWLINDLEMATKPEARAERPWIIIYGHRPMYCTSSDRDDCTKNNTLTRVGYPYFHFYAMEPLLAKYGVDMAVWAHEHTYERLWPMYNFTVKNGSTEAPYTNPKAPVHIITGSAGCKERHDHFMPKPYWSAFRSRDYGYTRLTAFNKTHLNWQQVSDDQGGKIVDNVWLVRDKHISYSILKDEN